MPQLGWIKAVSPDWVDLIAKHRPAVINIWQVGYASWARVQPGDLILLKRRGSIEDVIGFGTVYSRFPSFVSTAWQRYGFATGAAEDGDLQAQVAGRRTGSSVADPVIGNIVIQGYILFTDRPFKLFQQSAVREGHHPQRPIAEDICESLAGDLAAQAGKAQLEEAHASGLSGVENDARRNAWEDGVRMPIARAAPSRGSEPARSSA